MTEVVYISYDGLTDPLGRSQILPYLQGLALHGYRFTVVSLEKPAALEAQGEAVLSMTQTAGIQWVPVTYNTRSGLSARLANNRALKKAVTRVLNESCAQFIHARSYPASVLAQNRARKKNIPFVFDMRGFWADERVEGKIWDLKKPHHRLLYRYFKRREKSLLAQSAHVVSLTQAAKDYLCKKFQRWVNPEKITVIPCCADLAFFSPHPQNLAGKHTLDIAADSPVLIYLGSVGTWYMLDEMIDFFTVFMEKNPAAVFLVVTQNDHGIVHGAFRKKQVPDHRYRVVSANRNEVPAYIACADAALFFVRPSFSKTASSPVKLGELMGCGLPVFANAGIGDMDEHAQEAPGLHLIRRFDRQAYAAAIEDYGKTVHSPEQARAFAQKHYSLEKGVEKYLQVYRQLSIKKS